MLHALVTPFRAFFPDRGLPAAHLLSPPRRWRKLLATACGIVAGCFVSHSGHADVPLDATARSQMQQWSALFWERIQTGQSNQASETFQFTDPRLNSPLVSPVRGAVRWLQRLQPQVRYQPNDPTSGTTGGVAWSEVRDLMQCGWLVSDLSVDPDRAWTHILVAYEAGAAGVLEINGTVVQSVNLFPTPVEPDFGAGDPPPPVAADEAAFLLALIPHAAAITSGMDTGPSRARDSMLGRMPYWDEFALQMHNHVLHSPTMLPTQVSRVEAAFGDGVLSLMMICVQAGHAYVLIDPLTGQVSGPFHERAPINARPLLAAHSDHYSNTDRVEYVGEDGAVAVYITPIGGTNPYPSPPQGSIFTCYGCIACISAATASCAVLCTEQSWWDTPGEGFGTCMTKCAMSVLGIPMELLPAIRGDEPFDPAGLSLAVCDAVCTGCGSHIIRYLRGWSTLTPVGNLQPAPGWVGGPSACH